jgi:hypothetical protein
MNRLDNRRNEESGISGTAIGILLMAFVVIVFAGAFYYYITHHKEVDSIGCPKKEEIPERWVVIVDTTSKFEGNQAKALENFVTQITSVAPKYSRIKIYDLSENVISGEALASVCSPGDPANIDKWTEGQRKAKQRFDNDFKGKIDQVIAKISKTGGSSSSPIMESIQSVALLEFGDINWNGTRRLFVISDFLQFSKIPELDFYRNNKPDFELLSKQGVIAPNLAQLTGVRVYPMMIPNAQNQDASFGTFWKKYFLSSKAAVSEICYFGATCDLSKL